MEETVNIIKYGRGTLTLVYPDREEKWERTTEGTIGQGSIYIQHRGEKFVMV